MIGLAAVKTPSIHDGRCRVCRVRNLTLECALEYFRACRMCWFGEERRCLAVDVEMDMIVDEGSLQMGCRLLKLSRNLDEVGPYEIQPRGVQR